MYANLLSYVLQQVAQQTLVVPAMQVPVQIYQIETIFSPVNHLFISIIAKIVLE